MVSCGSNVVPSGAAVKQRTVAQVMSVSRSGHLRLVRLVRSSCLSTWLAVASRRYPEHKPRLSPCLYQRLRLHVAAHVVMTSRFTLATDNPHCRNALSGGPPSDSPERNRSWMPVRPTFWQDARRESPDSNRRVLESRVGPTLNSTVPFLFPFSH